ncbi:hypothetical protein Y032_0127g1373 [Ancylostoma ceylanicum]|uniref:Uncharacterized protein n=1 Tax=Ancylostoma ceylanicum TaxID=53326 RepID=A0A016T828_9BILA|nr:hypothetical protein Y032_0127g1373 [Ancylostoma ceylanicum]
MNRLHIVHRFARGIASAAPKTSTGIEHADALAKAGGKKPDWKLYKVGDYLKMNQYSFYDGEVKKISVISVFFFLALLFPGYVG